ncbi:MAG: type II toxin-antitoxin system ParD family antitoxin, partial [Paracoccus sp. (in: a-proteobacteria)]|nr:type II toxin-antitoxin system ParD family antitoxin [Paracoccus sp. (in: a-proteobacteria)]
SGRYANASDYIRDLIRRDEERRMSIAELQAFVDEAMASGPPQPFDLDAFLTQMHRKHGRA